MSILELYCHVDDFMQSFLPEWNKHLLTCGNKKRIRSSRLSISEMVTILILFQQSHYRDFKTFYLQHVSIELRQEFPNLLSYNRFIALMPTILSPMCAYLQSLRKTTEGISFVDSTPIIVCHNKRIHNHKVFGGLASLGKTSKGWFYGFKLHLICNHKGEIISCKITTGNVDDRNPVPELVKKLWGKLFGDKGYISKKLFEELIAKGIQLVTGIKQNMKSKLMHLFDKLLLRKRSLIESINNQLKNVFQIEHTRHRSIVNGFINIISALIAYMHHPNKPSIGVTKQELMMLQNLSA